MGRVIVGPTVLRGDPAIHNFVSAVVADLPFDVHVVSWNRPGAVVSGTTRRSHHSTGDAEDLVPAGATYDNESPCGGTRITGDAKIRGDILAAALRSAGAKSVIWYSCIGGNHYNHVHVDNGGIRTIQPNTANADPRTYDKGGILESLPVVGPAFGAIGNVGDAIRWLYEEQGLLRIAEVILGFGILTFGVVALIIDSVTRSETAVEFFGITPDKATEAGYTRAVGNKTTVREKIASAKNPTKAARAYRAEKDAAKQPTSFVDTRSDFPKRSTVKGSSIPGRHKQSESTRRRKVTTATKRASKEGWF